MSASIQLIEIRNVVLPAEGSSTVRFDIIVGGTAFVAVPFDLKHQKFFGFAGFGDDLRVLEGFFARQAPRIARDVKKLIADMINSRD